MSAIALAQFLGHVSLKHDPKVAENTFVVGGAVRNFLLGKPIKDVDIVIDSVRAGMDSDTFAKLICEAIPTETSFVTNQYGVAIVSVSGEGWVLDGQNMKGEVIEIANARKESYGGASGKGYKPHMVWPCTIEEDLVRREFTFNTMLWRLSDIVDGIETAQVLDLLGSGRQDLENRIIKTPADPNKTFQDDPTRIVRAFKFVVKYGFVISPEVQAAIAANAHLIHNMPWQAVADIFVDDVLMQSGASDLFPLMTKLNVLPELRALVTSKSVQSFWSRKSRVFPVQLQLDLWWLDFPIRDLSFLTEKQIKGLRNLLTRTGDEFVEVLRKPPVDNMAFIEEFSLQGSERARPVKLARELLMEDPSILPSLNEAVRGRLSS